MDAKTTHELVLLVAISLLSGTTALAVDEVVFTGVFAALGIATGPDMGQLILKRAPIGWNQDDYDVVEDGVIVGRIFLAPAAPDSTPWMWANGHNRQIRRAAHGYAETREAAMAAFAKSWRRE